MKVHSGDVSRRLAEVMADDYTADERTKERPRCPSGFATGIRLICDACRGSIGLIAPHVDNGTFNNQDVPRKNALHV